MLDASCICRCIFHSAVLFISLVLLFTDNSPSEEPPATAEKEEETEESDHEGEPFAIKTE